MWVGRDGFTRSIDQRCVVACCKKLLRAVGQKYGFNAKQPREQASTRGNATYRFAGQRYSLLSSTLAELMLTARVAIFWTCLRLNRQHSQQNIDAAFGRSAHVSQSWPS